MCTQDGWAPPTRMHTSNPKERKLKKRLSNLRNSFRNNHSEYGRLLLCRAPWMLVSVCLAGGPRISRIMATSADVLRVDSGSCSSYSKDINPTALMTQSCVNGQAALDVLSKSIFN